MQRKIITLALLLTLANNVLNADVVNTLKDIGIGCLAGATTSLVIRCCQDVDTQHPNSLKAIAGLSTALLTLRSIKERQDINSTHLLLCILSTTVLSSTNAWDNVFGTPKPKYIDDSDCDEDEEDEDAEDSNCKE